ncbi:MAG: acyl carrier protein [Alphaproteobacteria bacterium]|uniref:Acyl carrier protein n=1 Tax=Candidatus Nitrobium versatile TaxID=2884831 RepID=A0A953J2L4_9BACT|nr:acyl carrier protein [Candidatus Nitrobium versatile]
MQVKAEVKKFVVENFLYGQEDNGFHDDVSFLEKGIIDSTGVLELVSFVETRYGIPVLDEELIPENFDSVNKLFRFIMTKRDSGTGQCAGIR